MYCSSPLTAALQCPLDRVMTLRYFRGKCRGCCSDARTQQDGARRLAAGHQPQPRLRDRRGLRHRRRHGRELHQSRAQTRDGFCRRERGDICLLRWKRRRRLWPEVRPKSKRLLPSYLWLNNISSVPWCLLCVQSPVNILSSAVTWLTWVTRSPPAASPGAWSGGTPGPAPHSGEPRPAQTVSCRPRGGDHSGESSQSLVSLLSSRCL